MIFGFQGIYSDEIIGHDINFPECQHDGKFDIDFIEFNKH